MKTKVNPLVKGDFTLHITNESLARESITTASLDREGEAYYQLIADMNNVVAKPVFAKVSYFSKTTGEELATKEFHFD